MKFIALFIIFFSLFHESILYSQYLERYWVNNSIDFFISQNPDKNVKFNLVEIFNPFGSFKCAVNYEKFMFTNRFVVMLKNDKKVNTITVQSEKSQQIWIRVINITNIIPHGSVNGPDLELIDDHWSIFLKINSTGMIRDQYSQILYNTTIKYSVYALTIYPSGNMDTWSSNYQSIFFRRDEIIFNAINKSIDLEYLKTNGDLLSTKDDVVGSVTFSIASRMNRDFLIIIVANGYNNLTVQYPPIYVNGCLTMQRKEKSCLPWSISYPFYIILACAVIVPFVAIKFDLIQVFVCSLILFIFISMIVWRLISNYAYFTEKTLYVICFGIVPVLGILSTILSFIVTKKYGKGRVVFTSLVLTVIILSIVWFTPLKLSLLNSTILFTVVTIVIAVVLIVTLIFYNHLTLTVGIIFICAVVISLTISLNNINSSIIPFIFIDFYNSIVYLYPDWIYYSPLLIDDLIIVISSPILAIIVGLSIYAIFKRSIKKKTYKVRPTTPADNYGSFGFRDVNSSNMTLNIVLVDQPVQAPRCTPTPSRATNTVDVNPRPIRQCNTSPPPYTTCEKVRTMPTAPAPDYDYVPHNNN